MTTMTITEQAALDARMSVARETDAAIWTPRYTTEALDQSGWMRSKGQSKSYRHAFTDAYVQAWQARFAALVFEIKVNGRFVTVDGHIFRSWTGARRLNGQDYTGPVYLLGTEEEAAQLECEHGYALGTCRACNPDA